jgi:hypothetical protein
VAQRGTPTRASLALVTARIDAIPRQKAPAELSEEEAEVWNAIVAAEPADWFSASTRPLLTQYCRHIVAARKTAFLLRALQAEIASACGAPGANALAEMLGAAKALDRLQKMQDRESRAIATLATKMRITQQATTNHRGNTIEAKKPWEF